MAVYPLEKEIEASTGEKGIITLKIEIPEKHYIYGNPKGPGIGKPTIVKVEHSDAVEFEEAKFLTPVKYIAPGFKKFVWIYRNETKIDIPYHIKAKVKSGVYKIKIYVQALLCSESACILRDFTSEYSIRVVTSTEPGISQSQIQKSSSLEGAGKIEGSGKEGDKTGSKGNASFKPIYLSSGNISNIIQAILYGLFAGFILNFMPCVLPVISLKIMDIVKHAGANRRRLVKLGTSFTLGIISTFVILASLAAFMGYNYGALFQMKFFLIIMIGVIFALTLSLFEVFTIGIPSVAIRATDNFSRRASDGSIASPDHVDEKSNQNMDAFAKGMLTTLLATPCSGPFLGGTLAWALTQTPAIIFVIFISVGIGMSLPYIILSINPNLLRFIPKSGNWMITFERVMAFLLLATTIYLVGILEYHLIMPTLWFLFFIALAFWQFGRFGSAIMPRKKRMISRAMLIIIILFGYFLSYEYLSDGEASQSVVTGQEFSISKLYENKNKGVISIIDFTADWCPNCKLVEKTSLHTSEVHEVLKKNNIKLFVADLTRKNPSAERLLKDLGSHSIPFLAVFPSGDSFYYPICLRDIYSEEDVMKAIEMAE